MPNETQSKNTKNTKITITAAVIVAAGLAAGVALARPGTSASAAPAPATVTAEPVAAASTGYGASVAAPEASNAAVPAPATTITIQDFAFGNPVSVTAGSVITVTNADGAPHTLTFTDGSIDTGTLEPGASISVQAPSVAGTYTFFCGIHPAMTGQLTVTA